MNKQQLIRVMCIIVVVYALAFLNGYLTGVTITNKNVIVQLKQLEAQVTRTTVSP